MPSGQDGHKLLHDKPNGAREGLVYAGRRHFFRVNAYLGREFVDGDSDDGAGADNMRLDWMLPARARAADAGGRARPDACGHRRGCRCFIYAGLGGFNARVSAHGFTDDEFARGCAVAHAHGVRVYVTLNVFVFDDELSDAVALGAHALELAPML